MSLWKEKSFRNTISWWLFLLAIIPVVLCSSFLISKIYELTHGNALKELALLGRNVEQSIQHELAMTRSVIGTIASSRAAPLATASAPSGFRTGESYRLENDLSGLLENRTIAKTAYLINSKKEILFAVPEFEDDKHQNSAFQPLEKEIAGFLEEYSEKAKKGDVTFRTFKTRNEYQILAVSPVVNPLGMVVGVVAVVIPVSHLETLGQRFLPHSYQKLSIYRSDSENTVESSYSTDQGVVANHIDFILDSTENIVFKIQIAEPYGNRFGEVIASRNELITILIGCTLLIALVAVAIAKSLTAPLGHLLEIVQKFASGNYENKNKTPTPFTEFQKVINTLTLMGKNIVDYMATLKEAYETIEQQNQNLEKRVELRTAELEEKTRDIQLMLQNINQGIFIFDKNLKIHSEYSSFLEVIFQSRDLSGREFTELLFSSSNIGDDCIEQVRYFSELAIDESELSFEINKHVLPRESEKMVADERKYLKFDWLPIQSANGTVEKIMAVVQDQTEVRKLQQESFKQRDEITFLSKIIKLDSEHFEKFIADAKDLIDDCYALISENQPKDKELSRYLRNLHTIKGVSRSFAMARVSNQIHTMESNCKNDHYRGEKWPKNVRKDLEKLQDCLNIYIQIHEDNLKVRTLGENDKINSFKKTIQHCAEAAKKGSKIKDIKKLQHVLKTIAHISSQIDFVPLEDTVNLLRRIGEDRQVKDMRQLLIIDRTQGVSLRSDIQGLIRDCLTHCYLNSIVHQSVLSDEPAFYLELIWKDGCPVLVVGDNGRGLALTKLLKIGMAKGYLKESASDWEIANLIFRSHVSTQEDATGLAGRGIGMNAVKNFLENKNCQITIDFTGPRKNDYRPFRFNMSLQSEMVWISEKSAG